MGAVGRPRWVGGVGADQAGRLVEAVGLLPGPQPCPGLKTWESSPILTSCPNDCESPPGPFGAIFMSSLSGAVGSSFWPAKTQIELACVGRRLVCCSR